MSTNLEQNVATASRRRVGILMPAKDCNAMFGGHKSAHPTASCHKQRMKRVATWVLYIVGAASIAYLALYAYALFRGDPFQPGDSIKIFRKDDAPRYS